MSLEVTGTIKRFLPIEIGVTKDGKEWQKQLFTVQTDAQYNNLYCFEVFGDEKVQNLTKYQKENDVVTVEFNVNTNEYKGKYYTTLSAWKISKVNANNVNVNQPAFQPAENLNTPEDDLPF